MRNESVRAKSEMRASVVFLTLGLAGCAGKTTSGDTTGGGSPAGGASGTSGQSPAKIDAGSEEERSRACQHAFAVAHSDRCSGPIRPADEAARASTLFEQDCMNQFELPGNGVTAAALDACASATEVAACQTPDGAPPECDLRGTLPGGAPCFVATQCESGRCDGTIEINPGGGTSPAKCGHCVPVARVGQPCPQGGCTQGSMCVTMMPYPSASCVALTFGGEGASCDELTAVCQRGLYCEGQSKRCTPLADLGEPCGSQYVTGCKPPLFCTGAPGTCKAPGETGAACNGEGECASGLGCAFQQQRCTPITWVAPGDVCDDVGLCLRGSCVPDDHGPGGAPFPGHCPLFPADGARCATTIPDSCEEPSTCFDGTCQPLHSIRCE
jgi:hypothetical protein